MALFMGFLIILGYQPGPPMINNNMDVLLGIAFSLAIANVMATGLGSSLRRRLPVLPLCDRTCSYRSCWRF